jgi:hypothetical protein
MGNLLLIKLLIPVALIIGGTVLLVYCNRQPAPHPMNAHQAAAVDSLRTAAHGLKAEIK